jgi:protein-tyrosine-phosphatase
MQGWGTHGCFTERKEPKGWATRPAYTGPWGTGLFPTLRFGVRVMGNAGSARVLVVCGGNTCRSPVLSLLLLAELHRIGRDDVEVMSAGADESLEPFSFPMNDFAIEALREVLAARNDVSLENFLSKACEHRSRGLSSFNNQSFDLIAFVEGDAGQIERWRIVARDTDTRHVPDDGYRALKNAGFPSGLKSDRNGDVLNAYRRQTALLLDYAIYLATRFIRHSNP